MIGTAFCDLEVCGPWLAAQQPLCIRKTHLSFIVQLFCKHLMQMVIVTDAHDGIQLRDLFFEVLLVALSQTADGDQLLQPMFLVSRHLKDRRDCFLLGAGDESASVDDDGLCF